MDTEIEKTYGWQKVDEGVAYFRTSSPANTGADKDSETRQRQAVEGFAARASYEI